MLRTFAARCFALCALSTFTACSSGFPPPPVTDSTHYQLCENDAHCAAGTYCQAGVCDADCASDVDCSAGSCDVRGKCETGSSPTYAPFAGKLSVSAARLDLAGQSSARLRVQNDGQATLEHFHVVSDDPAVTVTPARGSLPAGMGLDLQVQVQPGWSGKANLRTLSSGGVGNTVLIAESGLVGYLQGTVDITGPFALGSADLALDLNADLQGAVDDVNSLLWPARAAVTATDDGGFATIEFTIIAPSGKPANPFFDGDVERQVTLSGTHSGAGPLTGNYQEVITGLGQFPLTVTGTFQLAPSGAAHGLVAAGAGSFTGPTAPGALPASQCAPGDTSCPTDLTQRGAYYFGLAFPFEQWAWESSIADGQCLLTMGTAPVPCVNGADVSLAADAFAQSAAPAQLWEVFRAIASEAQLQGKDVIANTLQPANAAYQGAVSDAAQFAKAVTLLESGLHQTSPVGGILTSANLWRAETLTPSSSTLDKAAGDAVRFGGSVSAALFAAGQQIDRQRRSQMAAPLSMLVAQQVATGAFLDAAALATVNLDGTTEVDDGPGTLVDTAENFGTVAAAFDQLRQGLNPVGYPADYIPFDYNAEQPDQDIFQQLIAYVNASGGDLQTTTNAEATLESDDRAFEQSQAGLTSALASVQTQLQSEATTLCGAGASQGDCSGGQLATDAANVQAATLAMQEAATTSANAAQKLSMLQAQLAQETGDQATEIQALTSDGQSEAAVAIADAREQKQNLDWQCGTSVGNAVNSVMAGSLQAVGGFFTGGWGGLAAGIGAAAQSIGNTVSSGVVACEEDDNYSHHVDDAGQAALAESDAQIQIQELQNETQDNQLIAAIFDAQSASQASFTESERQLSLLNAATSQFQTDLAVLTQDMANAQILDSVQTANADPTFRLYQDQTGMRWADEMQSLRAEVFLATRAFDYMTNQSYANEADVFADATAADLSQYLDQLDDAYQDYGQTYGWGQPHYDILSLRTDILGITGEVTDPVTGQVLSPEQQFQAILNQPKNRDANGNLALPFNTNAASGGVALFSPDMCQDRLLDLTVNIVSSALSGSMGYVGLAQGGDTRLVDCAQPGTAESYGLSTKNALVSAGLNLPLSELNAPSVPPNTDLYDRPVMASSWVLSIDLSDPRNAWIDLAQIDDLELWVHHQALTVQVQ